MNRYLFIADEAGDEIAGSRRAVDYHSDKEGYFRMLQDLLNSAGEGCTVKDSELL